MAKRSVKHSGTNLQSDQSDCTTQSKQTDRSVKLTIISHACVLFRQRGYFGVSMNDIAEKTDISKSTVYHYFSSKDKLVLETIAMESEKFQTVFRSFKKNPNDSLDKQLTQLSMTLCAYFMTHGNLIIILAHEAEGISKDISMAIKNSFDSWQKELEAFLQVRTRQTKKQDKNLAWNLMIKIFGGVLLSKVYQNNAFLKNAFAFDTMVIEPATATVA